MGFIKRLIFWGGFTVGAYKTYQKFPSVVQNGLLTAGQSERGRDLLRKLPSASKTAQRYMAGTTLDEAIAVAKQVNARQKAVSLAYLGDTKYGALSVPNRNQIALMLGRISAESLNADATIDPTTLGVRQNKQLAWQNLKALLDMTKESDITLWIATKDHSTTSDVLALYRTAREFGYEHVGVTLQGALYRAWGDLHKLAEFGGGKLRIELGLANEPSEHGFPRITDGRDNMIRIAQFALDHSDIQPVIVSHDDDVMQAVMNHMRATEVAKSAVEFMIPYGVRPDLQSHLVREGYSLRVYLPWGEAWERYLAERLADEPSEAILLLGNL